MPKPRGRSDKAAERSGSDQDKTQTGQPAGPEQDQAKPGRRNRRDRAWEELCSKLGGRASSLDPAVILCEAMAMAGCAVNHADALMFYNAVANQQKTNILGMSVTAKCVRYMFEVGQTYDADDSDILEEALWPLRPGRKREDDEDGEP